MTREPGAGTEIKAGTDSNDCNATGAVERLIRPPGWPASRGLVMTGEADNADRSIRAIGLRRHQ